MEVTRPPVTSPANSSAEDTSRCPDRVGQVTGFTLVELVTVIGVVAILVMLAVPAVSGALLRGADAKCMANLKKLHAATMMYANDNDGLMPISSSNLLWHRKIYPYVSPERTMDDWNVSNPEQVRILFAAYRCPCAAAADNTGGKFSYGMSRYVADEKFPKLRGNLILLADGKNQTSLSPNSGDRDHGTERHSLGRDNYMFMDGHVELIVHPKYHSTNITLWKP